MLSNRELATIFWLIPFLAWTLSHQPVRASIKNVIQSLLNKQISTMILLMAIYTAAIILGLRAVALWNLGLFKDSIMWFVFSAFAMMMNITNTRDDQNLFKAIVADNIKAMVLLEFVVNAYNFSLLGEIVFVPVISLIAMVNVYSGFDKKHLSVAQFTQGILAFTAFTLLGLGVYEAIHDYKQFASVDTLRSLLLPPALSILFSPFVFCAALYCSYENVFLRLQLGKEKPQELIRYAKRKIILHFGVRLNRLRRFQSNHALELLRAESEKDIDDLISKASCESVPQPNVSAEICESALVPFQSKANQKMLQMVQTTWKNTGDKPIRVVDATFTFFDDQDEIVGFESYTLYATPDSETGIQPNETFTTPDGEGFVYLGLDGEASSVNVEIISANEWSGI